MAVSNYNRLQYFKAGADLSKGHGLFVKLGTDGRAVVTAAATDPVLGVVITPVFTDLELGVCTEQGVKVPARANAAIAVGDRVGLVAGGKIATSATGAAIGVALEAATAADQIITILFTGMTPATA